MTLILFIGILLAMLAEILSWTQVQAQFMSDKFKNNYVFVILMSPIVALVYWKANYLIVNSIGSYWSARLIFFSCGTIMFSLLTYIFLGEGITLKTAISILLACLIVLTQIALD